MGLSEKKESSVTPDTLKQNLRFYNQGRGVPADALKPILAGRLKGKSDINPMWRMMRMTEIFGPIGFGWRYEIEKMWTETYESEVKCFCNVNLYIRDPETKEWSAPIPGTGGSALVSKEKGGNYVDDDGYKKALTDALSIAMKPVGIGGDIWYGPKATGTNESKYDTNVEKRDMKALLQQAITEMKAVRNEEERKACWFKWQKEIPEFAQNGTEFYKATLDKVNELRSSAS